MTRSEARAAILAAANHRRQSTNRRFAVTQWRRGRVPGLLPTFTLRTLDQAVAVVRAHRLVPDEVLVAAGFNPGRLTAPEAVAA